MVIKLLAWVNNLMIGLAENKQNMSVKNDIIKFRESGLFSKNG